MASPPAAKEVSVSVNSLCYALYESSLWSQPSNSIGLVFGSLRRQTQQINTDQTENETVETLHVDVNRFWPLDRHHVTPGGRLKKTFSMKYLINFMDKDKAADEEDSLCLGVYAHYRNHPRYPPPVQGQPQPQSLEPTEFLERLAVGLRETLEQAYDIDTMRQFTLPLAILFHQRDKYGKACRIQSMYQCYVTEAESLQLSAVFMKLINLGSTSLQMRDDDNTAGQTAANRKRKMLESVWGTSSGSEEERRALQLEIKRNEDEMKATYEHAQDQFATVLDRFVYESTGCAFSVRDVPQSIQHALIVSSDGLQLDCVLHLMNKHAVKYKLTPVAIRDLKTTLVKEYNVAKAQTQSTETVAQFVQRVAENVLVKAKAEQATRTCVEEAADTPESDGGPSEWSASNGTGPSTTPAPMVCEASVANEQNEDWVAVENEQEFPNGLTVSESSEHTDTKVVPSDSRRTEQLVPEPSVESLSAASTQSSLQELSAAVAASASAVQPAHVLTDSEKQALIDLNVEFRNGMFANVIKMLDSETKRVLLALRGLPLRESQALICMYGFATMENEPMTDRDTLMEEYVWSMEFGVSQMKSLLNVCTEINKVPCVQMARIHHVVQVKLQLVQNEFDAAGRMIEEDKHLDDVPEWDDLPLPGYSLSLLGDLAPPHHLQEGTQLWYEHKLRDLRSEVCAGKKAIHTEAMHCVVPEPLKCTWARPYTFYNNNVNPAAKSRVDYNRPDYWVIECSARPKCSLYMHAQCWSLYKRQANWKSEHPPVTVAGGKSSGKAKARYKADPSQTQTQAASSSQTQTKAATKRKSKSAAAPNINQSNNIDQSECVAMGSSNQSATSLNLAYDADEAPTPPPIDLEAPVLEREPVELSSSLSKKQLKKLRQRQRVSQQTVPDLQLRHDSQRTQFLAGSSTPFVGALSQPEPELARPVQTECEQSQVQHSAHMDTFNEVLASVQHDRLSVVQESLSRECNECVVLQTEKAGLETQLLDRDHQKKLLQKQMDDLQKQHRETIKQKDILITNEQTRVRKLTKQTGNLQKLLSSNNNSVVDQSVRVKELEEERGRLQTQAQHVKQLLQTEVARRQRAELKLIKQERYMNEFKYKSFLKEAQENETYAISIVQTLEEIGAAGDELIQWRRHVQQWKAVVKQNKQCIEFVQREYGRVLHQLESTGQSLEQVPAIALPAQPQPPPLMSVEMMRAPNTATAVAAPSPPAAALTVTSPPQQQTTQHTVTQHQQGMVNQPQDQQTLQQHQLQPPAQQLQYERQMQRAIQQSLQESSATQTRHTHTDTMQQPRAQRTVAPAAVSTTLVHNTLAFQQQQQHSGAPPAHRQQGVVPQAALRMRTMQPSVLNHLQALTQTSVGACAAHGQGRVPAPMSVPRTTTSGSASGAASPGSSAGGPGKPTKRIDYIFNKVHAHLPNVQRDQMLLHLDENRDLYKQQMQNGSLDQVALIVLRHFLFNPDTNSTTGPEEAECDICLDPLPEQVQGSRGDAAVQRCPFECKLVYHKRCIEQWLATSATCPTCNKPWPNYEHFPALGN